MHYAINFSNSIKGMQTNGNIRNRSQSLLTLCTKFSHFPENRTVTVQDILAFFHIAKSLSR
uniref:Uncharacterized protein n=1 Tax=Rhizophora mucronata TaxID=61149 RepID=A0A2P2PTB4_RHIMU